MNKIIEHGKIVYRPTTVSDKTFIMGSQALALPPLITGIVGLAHLFPKDIPLINLPIPELLHNPVFDAIAIGLGLAVEIAFITGVTVAHNMSNHRRRNTKVTTASPADFFHFLN